MKIILREPGLSLAEVNRINEIQMCDLNIWKCFSGKNKTGTNDEMIRYFRSSSAQEKRNTV